MRLLINFHLAASYPKHLLILSFLALAHPSLVFLRLLILSFSLFEKFFLSFLGFSRSQLGSASNGDTPKKGNAHDFKLVSAVVNVCSHIIDFNINSYCII